jgi:hypothetical protein
MPEKYIRNKTAVISTMTSGFFIGTPGKMHNHKI